MVEENSLVVFTRAEQMLAQAVTIQQAKELKNLALTAADWARRKNMGDKAISHARGYALEAERKMGQMLKQTERAKGGQPYQETPTSAQGALVEAQPTLAELGITKKESSRAQKLAGVPRESFDRIKTGDETLSKVNAQFRTSFTGGLAKKIRCRCPMCGRYHMRKVFWTGRGTPKFFCQACRLLASYHEPVEQHVLGDE